ncbi:hypothetical protein TNCV_1433351 [Trichonephila clavipes]|nr:hypothetical protein TNCV_1433351 [Trichonephila clavipes]
MWPPRSPDLNPCGFLALGPFKRAGSFAMREKCGNRLVPDPNYMVDVLKLPDQAPKGSSESLQKCVAQRLAVSLSLATV